MLSRIKSYALNGLDGYGVIAEVDIQQGSPNIDIVGLPDAAVKEAKERVRSAVKNSGYFFSPHKITINLAPAHTKKAGPAFDLAIALGALVATEQAGAAHGIPLRYADEYVFLGELSLSGEVRNVNGIMPILISARENGCKKIVIPFGNANEAKYIRGIDVYCVKTLRDAVDIINGTSCIEPIEKSDIILDPKSHAVEDLKYVKGQYSAKRALEIAAAGGHNIIMVGPPGGGKTMLAKCIPGILPDMTEQEALETTKIHSVAGILDSDVGIVASRPFRSPHHTASKIALTGGGANSHPGEVSYAHNGVLFLDELPEYPRGVLEILRQPLEDNVITVSRAAGSVEYPASFMLVASMNPCPCGYHGSALRPCTCTPSQIQKYMSRISGPLLDRIDLHIKVDEVHYNELSSGDLAESSAAVKERVNAARKIQTARYKGTGIFCNARMTSAMIKRYCVLDGKSASALADAYEKLGLSARAYTRILKVARTIADLAGSENIESAHIKEAVMYRSIDKAVQ